MVAKLDRTGEESVNNFGSKMIITKYRTNNNIDVYFPEYNWTFKNSTYKEFKKGNIKCPYEPRIYNHGYIGEGEYKTWKNGKVTKCYSTWNSMLKRCYDEKLYKKYPTYKYCKVTEEWLNYQDFGDWFIDNYYEIEGQRMCLDKDILHKGNKIYSPENCVFVPNNINVLFTKSNKTRGKYPIGVSYHKRDKNFQASCNIYDFKDRKNKLIFLGYYDTVKEAFQVYKEHKEKNIKQVADYYKDLIPNQLYNAMYNYKVEIID